jgi:hypothetical protein
LGLDKGPILSSKDVQSTVSNELVPATDVHRKKKSRFTLKCGEVKPNSIKVYELDIEGGGPMTRLRLILDRISYRAAAHFENLSTRVVWMI